MKKLSLLFTILFCGLSFAQEPAQLGTTSFQDWSVINEASSCQVATQKISPEVPFQLSMNFPKGFVKAPSALITLGPELMGQRVEFRLSSSQTEIALPLENQKSPQGYTYWYIPLDMDFLIERIVKGNVLEIFVQMADRKEPLKVSLRGSTLALKEAAKCIGSEELFNPEFFRLLNDPSIAPTPLEGETTVTRLQELFQLSYSYFFQRQQTELELAALRTSNADAVFKEDEAKTRFDLSVEMLAEAQGQLGELKSQIESRQKVVSELKSEERKVQNDFEQAERLLVSEKGRYEPLKKQFHGLEDTVAKAKVDVEALIALLTSQQVKVEASQKQLAGLQSETAQLESRIVADQKSLAHLKSEFSRFSKLLLEFNLEGKLNDRLQNEVRVQSFKTEVESLRGSLKGQEAEMRRAQKEQIRAQRDFEACRLQSADVSKECGPQITELQRAQKDFNHLQGQVRNVNGQISAKEGEVRGIEQAIRQELFTQRDAIQNEADQAAAQISVLENSLEKNQSRIQRVRTVEIPNSDKVLKTARAQKAELDVSAAAAATSLENAVQAFESFKVEQNYFDVEKSYVRAGQMVETLKNRRESLAAQKVEADLAFSALTQEYSSLETLRTQRSGIRIQMETDLKSTRQAMDQFKQNESQLIQKIETFKEQLQTSLQQYRYVLFGVLD